MLSAKENMLSASIYEKVAGFFKIVGDPTRCKIISVLKENEMCVGDISNVLSMTKSSISHQLSKMKEQGVVKAEKREIVCYKNYIRISKSLDLLL